MKDCSSALVGGTGAFGHQPAQPAVVGVRTSPGMTCRAMPGPLQATARLSPPPPSFAKASM